MMRFILSTMLHFYSLAFTFKRHRNFLRSRKSASTPHTQHAARCTETSNSSQTCLAVIYHCAAVSSCRVLLRVDMWISWDTSLKSGSQPRSNTFVLGGPRALGLPESTALATSAQVDTCLFLKRSSCDVKGSISLSQSPLKQPYLTGLGPCRTLVSHNILLA